jgi:hypothetical protein
MFDASQGDWVAQAGTVLGNLLPHLPETDDHHFGGVFCLARSNGQPILVTVVGDVARNKHPQCWTHALEKATRIGKNGDDSARLTRCPPEQWAGAFRSRASGFIGSFSGLPEDFDEIFVVNLMVDIGAMEPHEAFELVRDNPEFERLRKAGACIWAD